MYWVKNVLSEKMKQYNQNLILIIYDNMSNIFKS